MDEAHEAAAAAIPDEWVKEAVGWYSMHGHGLLRNIIAAVEPLIRASERERLAAVIPPEHLRSLAAWFDADDEFKVTMFPETWPHRGREVQDDLRKFADLLSGGAAS